VVAALNNPNLQEALERAKRAYLGNRQQAFADLDFPALRREIRGIKERAIADLPALVERFRERAQAVGATVHMAADAAAARECALGVARGCGASLIVKSKSMTAEEIGLNHYLEGQGLKLVETDLGDRIIQLAGERPSHIVLPALHKSREEIAQLFSRMVGREVAPDISDMVGLARQELRRSFVEAGMGISGANIALAATGTVGIVTNEGNGRLVTGLPPVHLALLGMDKVLPSLREAVPVLEVLAPSATGQRFTSYVSLITGPSRTADIESVLTLGVHGPGEVHIVLLDNGRTAMRDDPQFREALYCIRCAACLNMCPVFQLLGGHTFGHVYVGGIGTILTAFYHGLEEAGEIAELCLLCGACTEVCPSMIDLPGMILTLRERVASGKKLPWLEGMVFRHLLAHPKRFQRAAAVAAHLPAALGRDNPVAMGLAGLGGQRGLPPLSRHPLRQQLKPAPNASVNLYAGCLIDYFYPEIGLDVVRLLEGQGLSVHFPAGQACCGIPALASGQRNTAVELARLNIAALEEGDPEHVVTACPTCAQTIMQEFPRLVAGNGEWERRAQAIAAKTRDICQFLEGADSVNAGEGAGAVTYHDPCHLNRYQGVKELPRELLGRVGYNILEMADADACCGFAGTFSLNFPELSGALLQRKVDSIKGSGAGLVATGCPGCLMQLRRGLSSESVEAVHTVQLLARRLSN
jgi:iron-sulfur cluster protein